MENKLLPILTTDDWMEMMDLKNDSLIIKEIQLKDLKQSYEKELNKIPKWIRRLFGVQL